MEDLGANLPEAIQSVAYKRTLASHLPPPSKHVDSLQIPIPTGVKVGGHG